MVHLAKVVCASCWIKPSMACCVSVAGRKQPLCRRSSAGKTAQLSHPNEVFNLLEVHGVDFIRDLNIMPLDITKCSIC